MWVHGAQSGPYLAPLGVQLYTEHLQVTPTPQPLSIHISARELLPDLRMSSCHLLQHFVRAGRLWPLWHCGPSATWFNALHCLRRSSVEENKRPTRHGAIAQTSEPLPDAASVGPCSPRAATCHLDHQHLRLRAQA